MLTQATSSRNATGGNPGVGVRTGKTLKLLIVNGSSSVLDVLEPMLEAGKYDVVFVESSDHAYSQVRRAQPDKIVLFLDLDDVHGFRLLSMLKLDADTRHIPVVTYTAEPGDPDIDEPDPVDDEEFSAAETPVFAAPRARRMN